MVTLEQLRHFVAVVERGTLSAAADELHLSQPALSRSIRRLEQGLPAPLLARSANRAEVTEAGLLVAEHARTVLAQVGAMERAVHELVERQRTITVVSCAPAPLWQLVPLLSRTYPGATISTRVTDLEDARAALRQGEAQLVVTTSPPRPGRPALDLGAEHLRVSVPPAHPAAGHPAGVHLADLDGETLLLMPELGFWSDLVRERMPRATFLVQDAVAWREIARRSSLPVFTTDLGPVDTRMSNRVQVPVLDPEANPRYWCHVHPSFARDVGRLLARAAQELSARD